MRLTTTVGAIYLMITPSDIPRFLIFLDRQGFMPFQVSHEEILICKDFTMEDRDAWERLGPLQYAGQGPIGS